MQSLKQTKAVGWNKPDGEVVKLVNYRWKDQNRLGAEADGWIVDLRCAFKAVASGGEAVFPATMIEMLQGVKGGWRSVEKAYDHVRELVGSDLMDFECADLLQPAEAIEFLPPVLSPGKILCVGMNYTNPLNPGSKPDYPVLFLKPGSSMTGHKQSIKIPPVTQEVKIEGELAVVIGKRGKNINQDEAGAYIAGYTIANDVTASDLEKRTSQWATGKILDTFTPTGPYLVTADEIDNPNNLRIKTTLNEQVVQDANTIQMIFNVAELVSYISNMATLEPGDLILTGSPKRNGEDPVEDLFIHPGDRVAIEIENLGRLENFVIKEMA